MSEPAVIVTPPGALERLGPALQEYMRVRGVTSEEALAKKGEDLVMRLPGGNSLNALFQAQAQRPGRITAVAKSRGFRLRRRTVPGGISDRAYERADRVMGGYKSILAVVSDFDGRIDLRGVRVGVKGQRITGGRRGTGGFAVPGSLATNADREVLFPGVVRQGDVRLNRRAVATVMEINLREAGRKFLAVGFLLRRFRRIQKERVIRAENPRAAIKLQGQAAFEGSGQADNLALRISNFAPGAKQIANSRALISRSLNALRVDLEQYLARKHAEALSAAVMKVADGRVGLPS